MFSFSLQAASLRQFALLASLLACLAGAAEAQTPSRNLMPDGSHDMYLGLGAISRPYYEGAGRHSQSALPVVQMQWSNGVFLAGTMAGWHLSGTPGLEYGPLLAFEGKRTASGHGFIPIGTSGGGNGSVLPNHEGGEAVADPDNKLAGLPEIPARLQAGGFFKLNLNPQWQWQNNLLTGAGPGHNGLRWSTQLQYAQSRQHHTVSLTTGFNWVNRSYNQTYFGVPVGALNSLPPYQAGSGIKDVFADLNWNVALGPAWLLTSKLKLSSLQGSAARSPLVERRSGWQLSTALAYRF